MESPILYFLFGSLLKGKKAPIKASADEKKKIIEETESYKKDISEIRSLTSLVRENRQHSYKYL